MTSKIRWSLPEGVDELLPPKALQVEKLRRRLLDLYLSHGYEFIIPPLLELSETLGGEAHEELQEYAFSFKDDLTGQNISIRPDMSEQASRIDAYRMESDSIVKLCYVGDVVKRKVSKVLRSRTTIQAGAEIFGDSSLESDKESINLMLESLKTLGIKDITLSLGHAGIASAVLNQFQELNKTEILELEMAVSRKSISDIEVILHNERDKEKVKAITELCGLYGDRKILETASKSLAYLGQEVQACLDYMKELLNSLEKNNDYKLHVDLGEVLGFKYHNGIVFSSYTYTAGYSLAKGGRYDGLRKLDDVPRPAVGFDLDLLAAANFTNLDLI